jgi:uncharacterized alkaline shock family protein YloU
MKKIIALIGFIVHTVVFLLGVGVLYVGVNDIILKEHIAQEKETAIYQARYYLTEHQFAPFTTFALGSLMIILPVAYGLGKISCAQTKKANIFFESSEGKVSISNSAITDFVNRICSKYEEVSRAQSRVLGSRSKPGEMVIAIDMDILGGTQIPESVEKLQQNIKRQINELLGLENVASIEINIAKIISQDKPESAEEIVT